MRCRILSDLHLELHPFAIPPLTEDPQTVLVLAGDIGMIKKAEPLCEFLVQASRQFRAVVYVLGNHEFYRSRWPGALAQVRGWGLPANVQVLEREVAEIDGVAFVGATLWTDFERGSPTAMITAGYAMNDFTVIGRDLDPDSANQRPRFLPEHALADHRRSRAWLSQTLGALHARGQKAVLVTHHGIAPGSIHARYRGDALTGAFVSDLTPLLRKTRPALAIHGHVHDSFDYVVGATRVVVNPRGYARDACSQENKAFNPHLTVEV